MWSKGGIADDQRVHGDPQRGNASNVTHHHAKTPCRRQRTERMFSRLKQRRNAPQCLAECKRKCGDSRLDHEDIIFPSDVSPSQRSQPMQLLLQGPPKLRYLRTRIWDPTATAAGQVKPVWSVGITLFFSSCICTSELIVIHLPPNPTGSLFTYAKGFHRLASPVPPDFYGSSRLSLLIERLICIISEKCTLASSEGKMLAS